jgi:S-DNA-T family DNA segregation ATPase FtsK/SpoIIIE
MNKFFKKFHQDVRAIGFLGVGLFFALALASFNPKDPSLNSVGHGLSTLNYCGLVGSFLADLVYQGFGLTAWIAIAGLFHAAYMSFKGEKLVLKNIRHILGFFLISFIAALVTIYFPTTKIFDGQIYPGGLLGLGLSTGFVKILNSVGAQVLLWTASLVLFVFYFEFSIQEAAERPLEKMQDYISDVSSSAKKSTFISDFFKGWSLSGVSTKIKEKMIPNKKNQKTEDNSAGKKQESSVSENLVAKANPKPSLNLDNDDSSGEQLFSAADHDDPVSKLEDGVSLATYESPTRKRASSLPPVKTPRRVENWTMPKLSLLDDPPETRIKIDEKEIRRKAEITLDKLKQFSVNGQITAAKPGPVVTMFEFKPNADVRVNKVTELADDLSLALSAESLRIIAPIPGRDVIGIETSNAQRETVYLKDLLSDAQFWSNDLKLPIALGKQTNGEPRIVDLRKMPHLLIAGTTGSGKSVFTVSTIIGFLFKHSPKTLRLILVDPKQVDLAAFADIPHLIMPPIRDPKKAVVALRWAVKEMEKRYKSMSKLGARNIEQFNEMAEKFTSDQIEEHEKVNAEYENQGIMKLEQYYYTPQPYIVIAVEEFGDLMAVDKQNVEQNIVRLAQMARACGMHLMLAMQSPRKEVVTGLIKTNIPGRISFKVASKMDSRIILDEQGAERLLSQGDMLFIAGSGKSVRHHGPFLKETEINNVAQFWSDQGEPEFDALAMRALEGGPSQSSFAGMNGDGAEFGEGDLDGEDQEYDEKYDEILSWASGQKAISASLIQRRFKLGYPRAARLIEVFEKEGVVGPSNGSKPRAVLVANHNPG